MYKFKLGAKTYEIPEIVDVPAGVVRKARKTADQTDQAFTLLEAVVPEDSPLMAELDKLTVREIGDWFRGWTQGASLGESLDSEN
jgi:hypothetical protein